MRRFYIITIVCLIVAFLSLCGCGSKKGTKYDSDFYDYKKNASFKVINI